MVKCFKLVNGDEVLADVENETEERIQLKHPVVMMVVGEGQLGMVPWVPLADQFKHILETKHIILSYIPKQELINAYKQRTGGIVSATAGVLNQLPSANFNR